MNASFLRLGILTFFSVFLCALFLGIQPMLFRLLPNDNSRHSVIIDALSDENRIPEIVFFGDSRTMFGIDTKTIANVLDSSFTIYNLGSVAQKQEESSYFYPLVQKGVRHVIQCIDYGTMGQSLGVLDDIKAISLIMNGYHEDLSNDSLIGKINPYFFENTSTVSFVARRTTKSFIHSFVRRILDNENWDNNINDLFFPNIYLDKRHPQYPFVEFTCHYDSINVEETRKTFFRSAYEYFDKSNIRYHLLLMPINPDVCDISDVKNIENVYKISNEFSDIGIIDVSKALESESFYDSVHANRDGAKKLSLIIAEKIKTTIFYE